MGAIYLCYAGSSPYYQVPRKCSVKIKGTSPKTGKGKVSVIYRQPSFETLKSTGVTVAPADFDQQMGKVQARVPEHPELNCRIQDVVNNLETAVWDVQARYGTVTKALLEKAYKLFVEVDQKVEKSQKKLVEWYLTHVVRERAKLN